VKRVAAPVVVGHVGRTVAHKLPLDALLNPGVAGVLLEGVAEGTPAAGR
jgi:hypothetical protein